MENRKPTLASATPEEIRKAFNRLQNRLGKGICELCDTQFTKKRRGQRFCSKSCRALWWRLKSEVEAEKAAEEIRNWIKADPSK